MTVRARVLSAAVLLSLISVAILSQFHPTSIESATSADELSRAIKLWDPATAAGIGFALGFDYLFMVAYVTALGLGCAMVAARAQGFLRRIGIVAAYAQIAAGLIDVTENTALIRLITAGYDERLMSAARFATASKFYLPVAGLAYILIAWPLTRLVRAEVSPSGAGLRVP